MRKVIYSLISLIILMCFFGCATTGLLPKSASEIDFENRVEGKTGWSRYEEFVVFNSVDLKTVYEAAKAGLAEADFALINADLSKQTVLGEHGITIHDWNVIAGIYFREIKDGVEVKVIVEGSKDIGFSGDVTGSNWTVKIIKGMREYIASN